MDYYTSYNPTNKSSSSTTPIMISCTSSSYTTTSNTTTTNNNTNGNKKKGNKGSVRLSTDPQSVAARERRHRISERFKMLQSLVPGGSKLDTVSMLEHTIQYVKFLKSQLWLHQAIINSNIDGSTTNNNNNNYDQYDYNYSTYNNNYDQCSYEIMWNNNCNCCNEVCDRQEGGGHGGGGGGGGGFGSPEVAPQATPTHVQGFSFGYHED